MTATTPARTPVAERIYALLPAIHRIRDAERGYVLRELVEVLAAQVELLDEDLAQYYDDQFIETCAAWVAPYLGDLVGYHVLHSQVPRIATRRAEVANTVRYRRRKGTASMLEQLAADVTGWPARVVEFFERLVTAQYLNHVRPHATATADLRDTERMSWIGTQAGAFDTSAHTADLRGRYNIPNIGIVLWRTAAVPVVDSPLVPHAGDPRRFRFDPLGADAPLFAARRTEGDISHLAEPFDVPLPLTRRWLAAHLDRYYGPGQSFDLGRPSADIRICDLSDVPGGQWAHEPPADEVAVDPVLGRVHFGTAPENPRSMFHQGLAVPIGARCLHRPGSDTPEPVRTAGTGTVQSHLDALEPGGTLRFPDAGRYAGAMTVKAADRTVLHADDQTRPVLLPAGPLRLAIQPRAEVVLDGLLVAGAPVVLDEAGDDESRSIVLRDCTLVPGQSRDTEGLPVHPDRASLIVLHPFAEVTLERCVLGPIVAVEGTTVVLRDCVLDGMAATGVAFCGRVRKPDALRTVTTAADEATDHTPGGDLDLRESTVVGGVEARVLNASNTLLHAKGAAAIHAQRRQTGCLRFSYVPAGSRTGRRYRCVSTPPPEFTSLRYGHPAYAQLKASTPDAIRRGADDESEMGASHLLFAPQREANLVLRLSEYLRFGLEARYFYAT